jgi:hypothetical protein
VIFLLFSRATVQRNASARSNVRNLLVVCFTEIRNEETARTCGHHMRMLASKA